MSNGTFLYPNVTTIPSQTDSASQTSQRKPKETSSEFDQAFDRAVSNLGSSADLDQVKSPLKFSAHATQRLKDRKIAIDPMTMAKITDAVDKAEAKGVEDTLVLTPDAALIVNVSNRTVITALDRKAASGNVFTNIDGAVIV